MSNDYIFKEKSGFYFGNKNNNENDEIRYKSEKVKALIIWVYLACLMILIIRFLSKFKTSICKSLEQSLNIYLNFIYFFLV